MVIEHLGDIGKEGTIEEGNFTFRVRILDVKQSYGRTRWLVTPVAGSGEAWTEGIVLQGKSVPPSASSVAAAP